MIEKPRADCCDARRSPVMATPRNIQLEITSRCNLNCSYCYYFDNEAVDYHDLPTEEWLQFFDECRNANVMSLTIAGGEPFMRKDLRTLLDGVVRNRMRFSLLSNGGLINDDIAAFIADTGRCDHIQISIDGSCAETHDVHRGKGSFERAVKGIRTLQRHAIAVAVRVTIHRYNVSDLENTAHFLLEELRLPCFGTNSAGYLGSCSHNSSDVLLTTQQRQQAMETLLRLTEKYPGRISATAGPLAEALTWRRMEDARTSQAPAFFNGGHLTGCGCHSTNIAVRADGAYVTCSLLAHESLGWINHDSLVDVWQNSAGINRMRQRHTISLQQFEFCSRCPYVPYCTGNCPAMSYPLTGDAEQPSPDACLLRFLEDGGIIPSLGQIDFKQHLNVKI